MAVAAIVRPLPISAIGGTFPNVSRLLTPDPKEAAITASSGIATIDIDLGSVQSIDTIFLGYTSGHSGEGVGLLYGTAAYDTTPGPLIPIGDSDLIAPRRHFLQVLPAPISARYIRLTKDYAANYAIGVVAVGLAFRPTWGHEYGSGRIIESTGTAERLFGGGFGIDEGVTAGGWQWTFGDLQEADRKALYAIARNLGETKTVLVIEDPASTELTDACHWGLFRKLEAYERLDPKNTRWSFQIGDWE